jgi:hypothetical protein
VIAGSGTRPTPPDVSCHPRFSLRAKHKEPLATKVALFFFIGQPNDQCGLSAFYVPASNAKVRRGEPLVGVDVVMLCTLRRPTAFASCDCHVIYRPVTLLTL